MSLTENINNFHSDDVIFGGIDGIVSTFAIICGCFGSGQTALTALVLAASNLIADGFSMGVSSYTSKLEEDYKGDAFNSGVAKYLAFVLIGLIPVSWFILVFAVFRSKTRKSLLTKNDIMMVVILSITGLGLVGLFKGCYRNKKQNKNNDKNLRNKILCENIIKTILIGSGAGILAYLTAHIISGSV